MKLRKFLEMYINTVKSELLNIQMGLIQSKCLKMFNCSIFYEIALFYLQASTYSNYPYEGFQGGPQRLALIIERSYVIDMLIINEFGGKRAETNFTFIAFIFLKSKDHLVFVFSRTVSVTPTTNIFCVFVTVCRKQASSLNFAINKQFYLGQLNNSELRFPSVLTHLYESVWATTYSCTAVLYTDTALGLCLNLYSVCLRKQGSFKQVSLMRLLFLFFFKI